MGFLRRNNSSIRPELAGALRDATAVTSPPVDVTEFANAASGKKFVIIGERHSDPSVATIVEPFLQGNNRVFAEALTRGDYSVDGEVLKRNGVYAWNPVKYDNLVDRCTSAGVHVHGIDLTRKERDEYSTAGSRSVDSEGRRVGCWAEYILRNMHNDGQNIILVGALHVSQPFFVIGELKINQAVYSSYSIKANIITQLVARGIAKCDMISIVPVKAGDNTPAGIHKADGEDGAKIADFVYKI